MVFAQTKRILIIGVEGASPEIISSMIKEHELPNIEKILNNGTMANITSELPLVSPVTWTSFATSSNPSVHGIFGWQQCNPYTYKRYIPFSTDIKAKTFWSVLSDNGEKVIIVNAYMTYPPNVINGTMVSGSPSPSLATYPPELKSKLKKEGYVVEGKGYVVTPPKEFFQSLKNVIEKRTEVALELMNSSNWDLCFVLFNSIDRAQHPYWRDVVDNGKYKEKILDLYKEIDKEIGRLTSSAPNANVVIVNDHSFRLVKKRFHVDFWLMKNGYLRLKSTWRNRINLLFLMFQTLLKKLGINNLLLKLILQTNETRLISSTPVIDIDYNQSKAFTCSFYSPGIYINRNLSPLEREEIEEVSIKKLENLRDPDTKVLIFKEVYKTTALYGEHSLMAPDIILLPNDGYSVVGGFSYYGVLESSLKETGTHKMGGFLITNNKAFANVSSIEDIGKRILSYFGIK